MIHWKTLPKKYRSLSAPKRCKVFPKGMGSFIRELTLKDGEYEGTDRPLSWRGLTTIKISGEKQNI